MLFSATIGRGRVESDECDVLYCIGLLERTVRLGSGGVEPRQCVRTPGTAEPAGRRLERSATQLSGNPHELHSDGFHSLPHGGMAVSANLGGKSTRLNSSHLGISY